MRYIDFNKFIYNQKFKKKEFVLPESEYKLMFDTYLKALQIYKTKGFPFIINYIQDLLKKRINLINNNNKIYSNIDYCNFSDIASAKLRKLGLDNGESTLCLERASSLCCALINIGIPAQIVIGKENYQMTRNFNFHAWVEISNVPVTDTIIVKKQWKEVVRYPKYN